VSTFRSATDAAAAHRAARKAGVVGQLPPTLHDVQQEQATVRSKAKQIQAGMDECLLTRKLDPSTQETRALVAQWEALRDRAYAYADEDFSILGTGWGGWIFVTDNDLQRGRQLERDLQPWFDIIKNCGGKMPTPGPGQAPGGGFDLSSVLSDAKGLLLLFLIWKFSEGRNG
jgi:hypothetical protein